MQQRLCLAKCLVHDPKVLLLDEPASGLDPRARIEIKKLIKTLGEMGKTVIVSSHILPELADFCNKIGVMERGNLLVSGNVDEVVRRVQPTRQLAIRPLSPDPTTMGKLREAINSQPFVEKVTADPENKMLFVAYTGNMEAQAALLRHLMVDGNIALASFAEAAVDLEDVFLRVTTGAVH